MTEEETRRFERNMANDKEYQGPLTAFDALVFILHYAGLIAMIIGLFAWVPRAFDYGLPAGLSYSGFVLLLMSFLLRRG